MNNTNTKITNEDFSVYNGEGTILRKAQLTMLEILEVIDSICKKNSIPYWIDYGTLLGAVRHSGFIPWDDDLDISVLRKDYKRLKRIVEQQLPKHLAFQDWINEPKLGMKAAKIRHKDSYFEDDIFGKGGLTYQGVFIDIFPVERFPSVKIKKSIESVYGKSFRHSRPTNSNLAKRFAAYMLLGFSKILAAVSRGLALFLGKGLVGNTYGGLNLPCTHQMNDIFPLGRIEFEGKTFSAPKNIDTYLKEIYGDYMIIPPKEKRITHASKIIFFDQLR